MNIAAYHVATYRAGEPGYYAPRPRGHLEVRYDSKRWLYDLRGTGVKASEARAFIADAWHTWSRSEVQGRFPVYSVERK